MLMKFVLVFLVLYNVTLCTLQIIEETIKKDLLKCHGELYDWYIPFTEEEYFTWQNAQ